VAAAALGLVAILWVGSYFLHRGGPKGGPSQPQIGQTGPEVDPIEAQQRDAINNANKLVAANDLQGAKKTLLEAAQLQGPLTADVQKKLREIDESIKDDSLRRVRQREEALWQQAMDHFNNGRFSQAQQSLREILRLPPVGTRKDLAQQLFSQITRRQQEEQLFGQAKQAATSNDPASLQRAADLFGKVIALNGPRQPEARQLQDEVNGRLKKLGQDQVNARIASLVSAARLDLAHYEFRSARDKAAQMGQLGDASSISGEINQAEQKRFDQLERVYNRLLQADDEGALQDLTGLQQSFQALADDTGGPRAADAGNYVVKLIPDGITKVHARVATRGEDTEFQQAEQRYQAVNPRDRGTLERSKAEFQAIANRNGRHAADAQKYLTEISARITALSRAVSLAPEADRKAIRELLNRYTQDFERKDLEDLAKIRPSLRQDATRTLFNNARSLKMEIFVADKDIESDGNTALAKGLYSHQFYFKAGPNEVKSKRTLTVHLQRLETSWIIVSLDVQ